MFFFHSLLAGMSWRSSAYEDLNIAWRGGEIKLSLKIVWHNIFVLEQLRPGVSLLVRRGVAKRTLLCPVTLKGPTSLSVHTRLRIHTVFCCFFNSHLPYIYKMDHRKKHKNKNFFIMWLDLVDFPWLELLRPDDLLQIPTSLLSLEILPHHSLRANMSRRSSTYEDLDIARRLGKLNITARFSWRKKQMFTKSQHAPLSPVLETWRCSKH